MARGSHILFNLCRNGVESGGDCIGEGVPYKHFDYDIICLRQEKLRQFWSAGQLVKYPNKPEKDLTFNSFIVIIILLLDDYIKRILFYVLRGLQTL
jgi:hypothetical protein